MRTMRTDIAAQLEQALNRLMLPRNRGALCAPVIAAAPDGVDAQTYPVLDALARSGPTTAARLAEQIGIDRSGTSRYADRLEALGLLVRSVDPRDARATRLSLTAEGERLIGQLNGVLADHLHELIADWPRGQAEALVDGIERLLDSAAPPAPESRPRAMSAVAPSSPTTR
jgi:DNA-binding MarR family transcriptional regulator